MFSLSVRALKLRTVPLLALTLAATSSGGAAVASATPGQARQTRQVPQAPAYQWPEAHQNASLTGVSTDPSISTANAAHLGVAWMTYTGGEIVASPVAAWSGVLHKTLVYIGNVDGYFAAYDQATGRPVWSVNLGDEVRSTALVEGSYVWIAPDNAGRAFKLNAATGATVCSASVEKTAETLDASPVIATPPGGKKTVYFAENDIGASNGLITAVSEADCSVEFSVTPEPTAGSGGTWDFLSYGMTASKVGLLFFGTADPDSAAYAINAVTGATVWRFGVYNPPPGIYDIGAGLTVSPPGVNGFADGVVYFASKAGYMYALDLATGAQIWDYDFGAQTGLSPTGAVDTAALDGNTLVFGDNGGIWSVNAVTGGANWYHGNGTGGVVDGAPAIVGPPGEQVVAESDELGNVSVLSLATGALLYSYQTGAFSTGSPAEVSGNLLDISGSGFLYDFAPCGPTTAPTTTVSAPADESTAANPDGSLTVSGTATGSAPINAVDVYVQRDGASGAWWDSANSSWTVAPYPNPATLAAPGTTSTSWTIALPVSATGGGFEVFASAVSHGTADQSIGLSAATKAISSFTVSPSSTAATLTASSTYIAPAAAVTISGSGYAPNESVAVTLAGATVAMVTASSTGTLPATSVTVPHTASFGPATLYATGATSGATAVEPIYVTNSWSQYGDTADHQASDLNDQVFARHLSVSPGTYLTPAWSFNAGAPISGSVVVRDGEGYVVDQAGEVFAIDLRTGLQTWSYQISDGDLIDTTPALSLNGNLLLVASTDGTVTALQTGNGQPAWTTSIGGKLEGSPSVSGTVAYVVSDNGTVTAIRTSTGKQVWQVNLGSVVQTSPAVNASAGLVYVADTAGTVDALQLATGATAWSVSSLGDVTAALTVGQGAVYVGSHNGEVHALNDISGASIWIYRDGSAITAPMADIGGQIVLGDTAGHVHALTAATGASAFNITTGQPVVGIAGAISFDAATLANGSILGSKPADSDPRAWAATDGTALDSQPTVVNGEVIVTGLNGMVTVYTPPGSPVY